MNISFPVSSEKYWGGSRSWWKREQRVGEETEDSWALPGSLGRSACHRCSGNVAVTQQRAVDTKTPIYSLQCADPTAISSPFSPFLSRLQPHWLSHSSPATAPCSLFLKLSSIFLKPVYLHKHFLQDIFLYLPVMDNGHCSWVLLKVWKWNC